MSSYPAGQFGRLNELLPGKHLEQRLTPKKGSVRVNCWWKCFYFFLMRRNLHIIKCHFVCTVWGVLTVALTHVATTAI